MIDHETAGLTDGAGLEFFINGCPMAAPFRPLRNPKQHLGTCIGPLVRPAGAFIADRPEPAASGDGPGCRGEGCIGLSDVLLGEGKANI